jgi:acetyltransferase-like isoleucine patch superfamily enzyme
MKKIYDGVRFREGIKLEMEEDTFIGSNTLILVPELLMRRGSQINADATLAGRQRVELGENVVVGYGALLLTASDTPEGEFMNDASPIEKRKVREGPIIVEDNAFIGSRAIIMPGVRIGKNSVVGAGSYISESVPENTVLKPRQQLEEKYRPGREPW